MSGDFQRDVITKVQTVRNSEGQMIWLLQQIQKGLKNVYAFRLRWLKTVTTWEIWTPTR